MFNDSLRFESENSIRRYHAMIELRKKEVFHRAEWLDSVDSTNLLMGRWLHTGEVSAPAIVIAEVQTAGKGRGGNTWFSPAGCLMFSLAWPLSGPTQSLLPLLFGMAVAKGIEDVCKSKPQIKWPNDVFVDGKKICGILIEAVQVSPGNQAPQSVAIIGAGVNCQVNFEEAPLDVQSRATSLHLCCKHTAIDRTFPEDVLVNIVEQWLSVAEHCLHSPDWLFREWLQYDLLNNHWVTVRSATEEFSGIGRGIDRRGALLLEDLSGRYTSCLSGTIVSYQPNT